MAPDEFSRVRIHEDFLTDNKLFRTGIFIRGAGVYETEGR